MNVHSHEQQSTCWTSCTQGVTTYTCIVLNTYIFILLSRPGAVTTAAARWTTLNEERETHHTKCTYVCNRHYSTNNQQERPHGAQMRRAKYSKYYIPCHRVALHLHH